MKTFNYIIDNNYIEKIGPLLVIHDKEFLNEVISNRNLMALTFGRLTFLNCRFINIDFKHSHFISCDFKNCSFDQTLFIKSKFEDCNLKNSKIFKSEFPKAYFTKSNFIECEFNNVDMLGTFFIKCKFIKLKFNTIHNLNSLTLSKSKIWNSNKWIEVNAFDNIEKIINELTD
jgi:uncharacterized protein YjbI with pentapeptide repeats